MDTRTPSTSARGVTSPRGVIGHRAASWSGLARAALLASTALTVAGVPAHAQDATWLANPGSGDFLTDANWNTGMAPWWSTAFFGASDTTSLTINDPGWEINVGGWTFNAGASHYDFNNSGWVQFIGAGIVVNGGSVAITNNGFIGFYNTSTAGSATITNNLDLEFYDNSTAGSASITNNNRYLTFINTSTAGSAAITNNAGGTLQFADNSTADHATIANTGNMGFYNSSTAGNADITNSGVLFFSSTARPATPPSPTMPAARSIFPTRPAPTATASSAPARSRAPALSISAAMRSLSAATIRTLRSAASSATAGPEPTAMPPSPTFPRPAAR